MSHRTNYTVNYAKDHFIWHRFEMLNWPRQLLACDRYIRKLSQVTEMHKKQSPFCLDIQLNDCQTEQNTSETNGLTVLFFSLVIFAIITKYTTFFTFIHSFLSLTCHKCPVGKTAAAIVLLSDSKRATNWRTTKQPNNNRRWTIENHA